MLKEKQLATRTCVLAHGRTHAHTHTCIHTYNGWIGLLKESCFRSNANNLTSLLFFFFCPWLLLTCGVINYSAFIYLYKLKKAKNIKEDEWIFISTSKKWGCVCVYVYMSLLYVCVFRNCFSTFLSNLWKCIIPRNGRCHCCCCYRKRWLNYCFILSIFVIRSLFSATFLPRICR